MENSEYEIIDCIIPTTLSHLFNDGDIFTVGKSKQKYRVILKELLIRTPLEIQQLQILNLNKE